MLPLITAIALIIVGLFFLEFILRIYTRSYLVTSSLNIKKIPILKIEREYEFLDSLQDKINWHSDLKFGWVLKKSFRLGIRIKVAGLGLTREFFYNTDEYGRRKTTNLDVVKKEYNHCISIYGCSVTYGHSLSDHHTYSWLLQDEFPKIKFNNYGVAGYSLYQSLLSIEQSIKKDAPIVTVIGFHEDLGWRNTCSFEWAERLQNIWKIPSAVSRNYSLKTYSPKAYFTFGFGERIRLLTVFERVINKLKFRGRGNPVVIRQTMEHLLLKIRNACEKNGSKLLIACLDDCESYYEFFEDNDFDWCVTGVNTRELNDSGEYRWILFPFDNHPNESANVKYCESIKLALIEILQGGRSQPEVKLKKLHKKLGDPGKFVYPHS